MAQGFVKKFYSWLDERFHLTPLIEFMRHKQVPVHRHSVWYYMGGVALFLFIIQVATGILLLLYYQPGVDSGYESVRFIVTKVHFGWLIRSIHSWSETPGIDLDQRIYTVGVGNGVWIQRLFIALE
jgi:cytochrome b6